MARQDLLHERGAGPRHADDKNWLFRPVARFLARRQQFRREYAGQAIKPGNGGRLVVVDLGPSDRVALQEMCEASVLLAKILIGLGEAEMQHALLLCRESRNVRQRVLQKAKGRLVRPDGGYLQKM